MTTIPELLPCPFCGSASKPRLTVFSGEPYVPGYVVLCDASGFDGSPGQGCGTTSGWGEDPEDAIAKWNRRADRAKRDGGLREAASEALGYLEDEGVTGDLPDSLRAALAASPAPDGWRPIETAPKDGTWFIARKGRTVFTTQGSYGNIWIPNGKGGHMPDPERKSFSWLASQTHSLYPWKPTHWQPLSASPKEGE